MVFGMYVSRLAMGTNEGGSELRRGGFWRLRSKAEVVEQANNSVGV